MTFERAKKKRNKKRSIHVGEAEELKGSRMENKTKQKTMCCWLKRQWSYIDCRRGNALIFFSLLNIATSNGRLLMDEGAGSASVVVLSPHGKVKGRSFINKSNSPPLQDK